MTTRRQASQLLAAGRLARSRRARYSRAMSGIDRDTAFEMAVAAVRYGAGVTREVGMDLVDRGVQRVLIVTDPVVATLPPLKAVVDSLEANSVKWVLYDRVRVEPTEQSWLDVRRLQWVRQQRVVEQIDLTDRQIVRGTPVRVQQP